LISAGADRVKKHWQMKPVHRCPGDITHMTALARNCRQLCMHYQDSSMPETLQHGHSVHVQFLNASHDTQLIVRSRQAMCMHCRDYSKLGLQVHDRQAGVTTAEYVCTNTGYLYTPTITITQAQWLYKLMPTNAIKAKVTQPWHW